MFKSESALDSGAAWGTRFISIMAGGTAIIPIVQQLENKENKKKFIRRVDEAYYGKDVVADDPKFQESYNAIDTEPHKSFAIGMTARLLVLAPLIAMTVTPAINNPIRKYFYQPIGKGSKWIVNKVGMKPSEQLLDPMKGAMEVGEDGVRRMQSNWDFIHETIGFDVGLTFLYSFIHEYAYKTLAKLGMKETDNDTLPGQQYKPAEDILTPTSADDTLEKITETRFSRKITPNHKQKPAVPEALYTRKLAAETDNLAAAPTL